MSLWTLALVVAGAGIVGGVVNAFLSDNGFFLPKKDLVDGNTIWRPGFLGNMFVGGVAAFISWGLYGPYAESVFVGSQPPLTTNASSFALTLSAFVGAILVGIAGSRWLTNEIDKHILRITAAKAAQSTKVDADIAAQIATVPPMEALRLVASKENT